MQNVEEKEKDNQFVAATSDSFVMDMAMELPPEAMDEDSWWLQEANNVSILSEEEDSFGDFKQADPGLKIESEVNALPAV